MSTPTTAGRRFSLGTLLAIAVAGAVTYQLTSYAVQWVAYKFPKMATLVLDAQLCDGDILGDVGKRVGELCEVHAQYAWQPAFDDRRWLVVFLPDGREVVLPNPRRDVKSIRTEKS